MSTVFCLHFSTELGTVLMKIKKINAKLVLKVKTIKHRLTNLEFPSTHSVWPSQNTTQLQWAFDVHRLNEESREYFLTINSTFLTPSLPLQTAPRTLEIYTPSVMGPSVHTM